MPTLTIDLTDRQTQLVEELVRSGRYRTVGDVLRDGLRVLEGQCHDDAAKLDALQAAAQVGIAALERGDYREFATASDLVARLNDIADLALSSRDSQH